MSIRQFGAQRLQVLSFTPHLIQREGQKPIKNSEPLHRMSMNLNNPRTPHSL